MDGTQDKQAATVETDEMAGAIESLEDIKEDTGDTDVDISEFDKEANESVVEKPEDKTNSGGSAAPQVSAKAGAEGDLGWDKERQRADEAEANFRKTQRELDAAKGKVATMDERTKQLEAQLAELTKTEEADLSEVDPSITDPTIVKAIKSVQSQLKVQAEQTKVERARGDALEKKIDADRLEIDRERTRQKVVVSIEGKLQKHFNVENPSRFRNEAIQMANKICEERDYSPQDRYEASEMLEQCYLELVGSAKSKNRSHPSVPTDTGRGSGSAPVVSEQGKSCSLREAVKDFRKGLGL